MLSRIRAWMRRRRERWDSICKQCGMCCYEKSITRTGEVIVRLNAPCRYLDPDTKRCTVYENRFAVCKDCKKLRFYHALFASYLPANCGYVERFRIWRRLSKYRSARHT
jgi:uncharacterized cysteine cluster protein YcgN (CxxCxxCC family)